MKYKIAIATILLVSLTVVPNTAIGQEKESQDALIVTRQNKAAFTAIVDSGQRALKEWEVHFYSTQMKNSYQLTVDGEVLLENSFSGFHHVAETTVGTGKISLVKVKLNGKTYSWKNIVVLNKSPTDEDLKDATEGKDIVEIGSVTLRLRYLLFAIAGAIASLSCFYVMYKLAGKRLKEDIMEGY